MKFGVHLPDSGKLARRKEVLETALLADRLRFDSVFSSDHIVWPEKIASKYPYGADGNFITPDTPWLDCIGTLFFVAGATEHVQLGSTVVILGYRPVIQQAKLWASLDRLSEGRAILGVGVGWMREEFEALGVPYDKRGQRADEFLEIFECLWKERRPSWNGPFTQFDPIGFEPKPVRGRIPVWVGGHTPPAFRRAARFADAWHAAFASPEEIRIQWDGVTRACEEQGRDPGEISLTALVGLEFDRAVDQSGWVSGSPAAVKDSLDEYKQAGVSHLVCFFTGKAERRFESIHRFSDEIKSVFV